jgi:hypothetical protein
MRERERSALREGITRLKREPSQRRIRGQSCAACPLLGITQMKKVLP